MKDLKILEKQDQFLKNIYNKKQPTQQRRESKFGADIQKMASFREDEDDDINTQILKDRGGT